MLTGAEMSSQYNFGVGLARSSSWFRCKCLVRGHLSGRAGQVTGGAEHAFNGKETSKVRVGDFHSGQSPSYWCPIKKAQSKSRSAGLGEVVMQEEQTVSFQPISNCGPQPWFMNLFGLFILVFLVVFVVRIVKLAANLYKLRNARKHSVPVPVVDALWADCYSKVHSFKEISTLTFLVSLLTFIWYTADVFLSMRAQKITSVSYVLARTSGGLVAFAVGLIFCIALYSAAMLTQAVIRRRKSAWSVSEPT
jgi:hypothetical protein